jgi:predicted ATPase
VIATLAQLDHGPSRLLQLVAQQIFSNLFIEKTVINETEMLRFYQSHPDALESINSDLKRIDLGIKSMSIQPGPNGPVASFLHEGLSHPIPLFLESHGTRQFLQIYPWINYALSQGGIAVLDEMDIAIHPHVLPEILRWFYSPSRNPHNAQLWMSCQNASLLEGLSKNEIYFCSKDARGATSVYALGDVAGVRRIDNFYKKYMSGTYGAVPNIG